MPGFVTEKGNICYISGSINREKTDQLLEWLLRLAGRAGTLILNSPGGDEAQGFAMYDLITTYGSEKLQVIAVGECQSAAILPFLACGQRLATPYTSFMIHHGTYEESGPVHTREFFEQMTEAKRYDALYSEIIYERTKIDEEELAGKMSFGWYFGVLEATEEGFIHGTIELGKLITSKPGVAGAKKISRPE